jgi:hypothetical protein
MTEVSPGPGEKPPTAKEKEALKTLVSGIVLAQGNIFIKELLRRRKIKIGTTKADFVNNMMQAVEDGILRRWDVDQWLDEVEGWGDQHVYLFKVPLELANDPIWSDRARLQGKLEKAGLGKQWNALASLEYPTKRKLTGVYSDGPAIRFVWHEGLDSWVRDKSKDYTDEIEGDDYEFRAHRKQAERWVMRFEMRPRERMAAVFMQIPWTAESHDEAMSEVKTTVAPVVDFSRLSQFSVSTAIKTLDAASLASEAPGGEGVKPQLTRLSGAGAYVEFASTSGERSYQDFGPVREVRRALKPGSFKGLNGIFRFSPTATKQLEREIKVQLYGGEYPRIRLWAQMTALEVWEILRILKSNA